MRTRYEALPFGPINGLMKENLVRELEAMRKVGMAPSPVYKYVIDHGIAFEKIPLTQREAEIVERVRVGVAPKIGDCFRNAIMMWVMDKRLKYCEGYCSAIKERIIYPAYHAWNCLYGKLVDVTPPEKYHFFGVVFPNEITEKHAARAFREREYTPILDDYVHNWEFLRGEGYF